MWLRDEDAVCCYTRGALYATTLLITRQLTRSANKWITATQRYGPVPRDSTTRWKFFIIVASAWLRVVVSWHVFSQLGLFGLFFFLLVWELNYLSTILRWARWAATVRIGGTAVSVKSTTVKTVDMCHWAALMMIRVRNVSNYWQNERDFCSYE